jgi:ubiquinone/menaquinone biosynthesis C-methylase UbiE
MTSSEKTMAQIMSHRYRQDYLSEIAALIPSNATLVLDVGCGVGALTALINQQMSSTHVVELDLSRYMLTHQLKEIVELNVSLIQALMPKFPFKSKSFDAVVAVQSLSEVLCFSGREVLSTTINEIDALLRDGGSFVVMDHQNPGDESIDVNLSNRMFLNLERFKTSFEYRPFSYEVLDDGWIRIAMRDLYEFITKIWAFDTPLEREEMRETHTPFSGTEFAGILEEHGFLIDLISGLVPFDRYLKRYKIKIRPRQNLPERFFLLRAKSS